MLKNKNKPAAAANPSSPPSAAPGTTDDKGKKEKRAREQYAVPEGGLESWPADYDAKKHKPLKRKDFKDESVYLVAKATRLEEQAKALRQEAEDVKKLGGVKDKSKAKKLLAMQKRMAEMQAELAKEGVDVAALLASLESKTEEPAKG